MCMFVVHSGVFGAPLRTTHTGTPGTAATTLKDARLLFSSYQLLILVRP